MPETREQKYYKYLFDKYYPNCENFIPRYWMPKFIDAKDSSARTLDLYHEVSNDSNKSNKQFIMPFTNIVEDNINP